MCDPSLARHLLGWEAKVTLEDGLARCWDAGVIVARRHARLQERGDARPSSAGGWPRAMGETPVDAALRGRRVARRQPGRRPWRWPPPTPGWPSRPYPATSGQNRALLAGLAASEADAGAWVCLDADLQDPPEAVPALLDRLAAGDVGAVFAGRRGAYESRARLLTGTLHRAAMARLTGLPADAGAFLAMDRPSRDRLLALDPPGIVAGIGAARIPCASVPVVRAARPAGPSAWTPAARLGQSARSLLWAYRAR